ncbi:uncharacterized protein LOC109849497 [Asparagus officinalis]|uniref:uncharacterized protein LOC109849497 n=1 Tax=Asparagus officinalis TaxID=4686 RepID=UPI00098E0C5A|nr:uncharacterized protein LOC109849497 [Asparagus officinalis]
MDYMNENNVVDQSNNGTGNYNNLGTNKLSQTDYENKKASVHAEMARVNKLPSNSSYALHRIKVLNKILRLLSIPRTISQEEELELLFAGLSL